MVFIAPLFMFILLGGNTWDYWKMGAFTDSVQYITQVLGYDYTPQIVSLVTRARIVILIILIIGAIEAYMAIKKKYGEELAKNEVLIKL